MYKVNGIFPNCRFVKSTALEIDLPDEFSEAGRYQARFIGTDIGTELDILEDKHASIISKWNDATAVTLLYIS